MTTGGPPSHYPATPDGRYFVVRGRLWRKSNPSLDAETREALVRELMSARRAVREAKNHPSEMRLARQRVNEAKVALGERGPVWWDDGAPDLNRHLVKNTPYAAWFEELTEGKPKLSSAKGRGLIEDAPSAHSDRSA